MTLREQIRAEMPPVNQEAFDERVKLCKEAAREGKITIELCAENELPPALFESMKDDSKRRGLAAALVSAGVYAQSYGADACLASCLLDISWA